MSALVRYEVGFATSGRKRAPPLASHAASHSTQQPTVSRWSSRSSAVIVRSGASSRNSRPKLKPMLVAPRRSRLIGSWQLSSWQMRKPRILVFLPSSTSAHGPHGPRHLQHVFDVPCSGVSATTKRLLSLRIRPTPIVGGLPRLTQLAPSVAPHAPYANTSRRVSPFLCMPRSRSYSRSSDCCALMYVFHRRRRCSTRLLSVIAVSTSLRPNRFFLRRAVQSAIPRFFT